MDRILFRYIRGHISKYLKKKTHQHRSHADINIGHTRINTIELPHYSILHTLKVYKIYSN